MSHAAWSAVALTFKIVCEARPNTFAFETSALVKASGFREYDARWWFGHADSSKPPEINLIGVQALVYIGVNMGLFPTKGLTLPLVSYGGSSLLIVFVMLGVLLRIDAENTMAESSPAPRQGGRQ